MPDKLPEGLVPAREIHPEHEEAVLLRDAMIAGLAGAASDLAQVGRELYRATVLTKIQRVVIYSTLGLMCVAMVGLFIIAVGNKANGNAIRDCTQSSGACYQRQQKQTSDLIAKLIIQNEGAAYCSPRSQSATDFKACVTGYARGATAAGG